MIAGHWDAYSQLRRLRAVQKARLGKAAGNKCRVSDFNFAKVPCKSQIIEGINFAKESIYQDLLAEMLLIIELLRFYRSINNTWLIEMAVSSQLR